MSEKPKRKLSEYQKFVKSFKGKGKTMKEIAQLWKREKVEVQILSKQLENLKLSKKIKKGKAKKKFRDPEKVRKTKELIERRALQKRAKAMKKGKVNI